MQNRRIVRNNAMRQETARVLQASLARRRPNRTNQPEVKISKLIENFKRPTVGPDALFTGGIGDFIAIESFLNPQEIHSIRRVYLATRAAGAIQALLQKVPIFPAMTEIISLHDDWSHVFCVVTLEDFFNASQTHGWDVNLGSIPKGIVDYSIAHVFPQIMNGYRKFNRCHILDHHLADISKFELPKNYAFVQPYSPNDRQGGNRDYTDHEWKSTLEFLRKKELKGVVVLNSNDYIPDDSSIINLANKTNIAEAMEIAKHCHTYIGVDSCFAALVTKFLSDDRLFIKSVNDHYLNNFSIYAAPHVRSEFVCRDLSQKLSQ
jgi:hypothetical protein